MDKPKLKSEHFDLLFEARILDGLPDLVVLVDRNHHVVDCNKAARDLLGADAVGQDLGALLDSPQILKEVEYVLKGNPGTRNEVSIPFPIACTYDLSVWRLPDLKSTGPVWAMVVLHDVTAAKKAEEMRADFVANVSHELRSPLSSLLGFIETLRGPASDDAEATAKFLEIMEGEAKRMARLINDLLALSKVETDEHIRPQGSVNLEGLLAQVANIMSVRAQERAMTIELKVPATLGPVLGDADELTQVFQNLVANAISYGKGGTPIRIEVAPVESLPGTGVKGFSVCVINQGETIPQESISRLTERFYRVDKGRSRSMGGTGLGLAIVKHIVARHRGHLAVQSATGEGTRFTVHLPAAGTTNSSG